MRWRAHGRRSRLGGCSFFPCLAKKSCKHISHLSRLFPSEMDIGSMSPAVCTEGNPPWQWFTVWLVVRWCDSEIEVGEGSPFDLTEVEEDGRVMWKKRWHSASILDT